MQAAVSSMLGRLVVVAALAGLAVLVPAAPAVSACRCTGGTITQHANRADAIFTATVTSSSTEQVQSGERTQQVRRYTAEVDRAFQGVVSGSPVEIVSPQDTTACGFGEIPAGEPWVFFVQGSGTEFRGTSCGGSRPAAGGYLAQVERVLGSGEVVVEPLPEQPPLEYSSLDATEPISLARLLAPGAALALLGLLGLALVRRRAADRH